MLFPNSCGVDSKELFSSHPVVGFTKFSVEVHIDYVITIAENNCVY